MTAAQVKRESNAAAERLAQRDKLLLAVMNNVPFDGWTERAMKHAAEAGGLDFSIFTLLFPRGIPDLLDHMADWADRQALTVMDSHDLEAMRVRDRITLAVRARLEALAPYKEAVRRSVALLSRPSCGGQMPGSVWRSADRFWAKAGDTATDYNRYTKRALLSGVIASTTLFWLTDNSEEHAASWAFLDSRIENVLAMGKRLGKAKPVLDKAEKLSQAPRQAARRFTAWRTGEDLGPTAPGSDSLH